MIGAGKLVADRVLEFVGEYGNGSLDMVAEQILTRSEAAMRTALRELPDGVYAHAVDCDGHRVATHIELTATKSGDTIVLDYTGSSPQRQDASINCVPNVTFAHSVFAIKCMLAPDVPNNEGLFRPISTTAPEARS